MINGKVLDEMMNKNSNTDATADVMMDKLKMEMAMDVRYFLLRPKHNSIQLPS